MICFVGFILRSVYIVGMTELRFNDISTLSTLNSVLLGSVTLMIRCMCCKIAFLCAACSLASVPVTACITCPAGRRIMRCKFTILYITYIADSLMLASGNIRTGRAVFSLAAVNYNATAHSRTLFPVISSVTVPSRRRGVCAGRNRCTGCNDFSTAEALCVAGIAVNLILVVRFTGIYGRCTAHMGVCILIALEGVSIVMFHISAFRAGIPHRTPDKYLRSLRTTSSHCTGLRKLRKVRDNYRTGLCILRRSSRYCT